MSQTVEQVDAALENAQSRIIEAISELQAEIGHVWQLDVELDWCSTLPLMGKGGFHLTNVRIRAIR